jgi:hypothetical protein
LFLDKLSATFTRKFNYPPTLRLRRQTLNASKLDRNTIDMSMLLSLLRGEMSAVETYAQAIEKFSNTDQIAQLRMIRYKHTIAVQKLREQTIRFQSKQSVACTWGERRNGKSRA